MSEDEDKEPVKPVRGVVHPPVVPVTPQRRTKALSYLAKIINEVWNHEYAWPFKQPVNAIKLKLPDYHSVIRRPIDLRTIRRRLANAFYSSPEECVSDFQRMIDNCYEYISPEEDVFAMAAELEEVFNGKLKDMPTEVEEVLSRNTKMLKPYANEDNYAIPKDRVATGKVTPGLLPNSEVTHSDNCREVLQKVTPERQQMRLLAQHKRRRDAKTIKNDVNYTMEVATGFDLKPF